jgi:hypothetical protein
LKTIIEHTTTSHKNKNYLRLLKRNADLHYENTKLKVYFSLCSSQFKSVRTSRSKHDLLKLNRRALSTKYEIMKKFAFISTRNYKTNFIRRSMSCNNLLCNKLLPSNSTNKLFKSNSDTCLTQL